MTLRVVAGVALGAALAGCSGRQARVRDGASAPAGSLRAWAERDEGDGFRRTPSEPLAARVAQAVEVFAARGTQRLAESFVTFLREGGSDGFRVTVARDQCVGFLALGREGIVDLNLRVLNAAGTDLDYDTRNDAHPFVRVCARAGDALHVRAHALRGNGEAAVVMLVNPPVVPPPLGDVLGSPRGNGLFSGPRAPRGDIGRDPAALSASDQLRRALDVLAASGSTPVGSTFAGSLPRQGLTARPIALESGRCYVVLGFGEAGVEDLDLRVSDPTGRPITQDVALDAHPTLRFCAARTGLHRVDLRMFAGSGQWALGAVALPLAASGSLPASVGGVTRARAAELVATALARGMRPSAEPIRGAPWGTFVQGFGMRVRRGRCYLVAAAGAESLPAIDLWLSGPDGALLASDTNERERAMVYHCPDRDAVVTANVRAHTGRGEYVVMTFESGELP